MTMLTQDKIEDIEFWRQLIPGLNISEHVFHADTEALELDNAGKTKVRNQIINDGYFKTPPLLDRNDLSILKDVVINLDSQNIMPIFLSLYDEFWQVLHKLRAAFTPFLQENYQLTPDFWIWNIPASDAERGWRPHRDGFMYPTSIRNDGTPTLATVWIPLTDVTTDNSCIYVLPRKHDALFQDFVRKRAGLPGIENVEKSKIALERLRALPVNAGEIIGWDTNIFHWGSGSSQWAKEPRISIGVYYEATDATEHTGKPYNSSLREYIDFNEPLSFEDRLSVIANLMKNYDAKFNVDGESEKHHTDEMIAFRDKWKKF